MQTNFSSWQLALACTALVTIYLTIQSVRRWRMLDGLITLAICLLSFGLLYSTMALQNYAGSDELVAHVKATIIANSPYGPTLSVELTTFDQAGQTTSDKTYLVLGNEWMLQGDIVKVSGLLGMIGLHSGDKLTKLEGRFDDPTLEQSAKHSVVTLNGGDDGFFTITKALNSIIAPFIDATYGNAVIDGAGSFNIYSSQSGLWAKGV